MTTARKLWLGFGTLIAVLVLSSLAIIVRAWSIEAQMREMARARNLSATASQLEISVLSNALGVRAYLQNGDIAPLRQAFDNAVALEQQLVDYQRMATTDSQRATSVRFAALWRELQTLTQALLDPDNTQLKLDHSRRLHELSIALKKILNQEIQSDAIRVYDARLEAAVSDGQSAGQFVLILLIVGTGIAVATSVAVGRGVVRSEARLWDSRERMRVTLASIGDAVITTDTHGNITYLNPVAEALTGWSSDAALGRSLEATFQIVNAGTRQPVDNPATRALREGWTTVGLADQLLIARNGSEHAIDNSAAPIRDERGDIAGVVLILRDMSERTRLENELRRSAADLSEADRRKDEFLAVLAHELRSPLAPISNALQVMQKSDGNSAAVDAAAAMMARQVAQMVRLVDDLLDVSRISRGKIELRCERVELADVIHQAVEAVRPLASSLQHELKLVLPAQPLYLHADPVRLTQVLGNLLNNACKFTDRGGRIVLSVECEPQSVAIRVQDSGIGIGAEALAHIFDLFVQVDTSLGRAESGVGIGLALVKRLVEMHGGTVDAQSAGLGQGSMFVVRLPLVHAADDAQTHTPEDTLTAITPQRILVVDDNHDSATSMATLLQLDGHDTRVASDGVAATAEAAAWRPDVVMLDIGLPGLNGFEVARYIRAQTWGRDMVLIAVTGWGQTEDRQRSSEAGFDRHLVKPASHADIVKVLEAFGKREQAQT